MDNSFFAEQAFVSPGCVKSRVHIKVSGGKVAEVATDLQARPAGSVVLPGLVVPGLVNAHSHVFHRAIRASAQSGVADFWAWREQMYEVAQRLTPDSLYRLARATYAEMVCAGITAVGEFHYVHHGPGGQMYEDRNAMSHALAAAADEAGIRLVLIDTCYLQGDVDGTPLSGVQLRFGDGDAEGWAERVADFKAKGVGLGAAIHSVRAVPPHAMEEVHAFARERSMPLHVHLSEQVAENDRTEAVLGSSPTAVLDAAGVIDGRLTAVHATHLKRRDLEVLGTREAMVCLCPTTERDLADGVGPARECVDMGISLCVGSDAHMVIDLLEDARAIELDERLVTGKRGQHGPTELLHAVTSGGARSLGLDAGEIAPGRDADFMCVRLNSPRTAGPARDPVGVLVFAASAADVSHVVIGGEMVVDDGVHRTVSDLGRELTAASRLLFDGSC